MSTLSTSSSKPCAGFPRGLRHGPLDRRRRRRARTRAWPARATPAGAVAQNTRTPLMARGQGTLTLARTSWKVTCTAQSTRATLRMDVASACISRCGSRQVLSRRRHRPGMKGRKHQRLRAARPARARPRPPHPTARGGPQARARRAWISGGSLHAHGSSPRAGEAVAWHARGAQGGRPLAQCGAETRAASLARGAGRRPPRRRGPQPGPAHPRSVRK